MDQREGHRPVPHLLRGRGYRRRDRRTEGQEREAARRDTWRIGHGGSKIVFLDPSSTGNVRDRTGRTARALTMTDFVHPEYLVETDWLAQHLTDPDVVVLDCTTHLIPDPKITYEVKPGREDFEKRPHPRRAVLRCVARRVRHLAEAALHAPDAGGLRRRDAPLRHQQRHARRHLQHRQRLVGDAGLVAAARVRPRQRGGAEWRLAEMARRRTVRSRPGPARPRAAGRFHRARGARPDGRQGGGEGARSAMARSAR